MKYLESIASFLSVVVIAWITQRIISYWERRKKIEETKLSIYMEWLPFFAEVYASAAYPEKSTVEPREFLKKKMEILGTLQLMGPDGAMPAFLDFCDDAERAFEKDSDFNLAAFHEKFTELNYQLCCEIHGETTEPPQTYQSEDARPATQTTPASTSEK
jgi:hypothetical protein